jgi:hypothetical protein
MSTASPPPPSPPRRVNIWSQLLLVACGLFILTVFLMVTAAFNRQAALLARFFDRHGMLVLTLEVGAILGLSLISLWAGRCETQRRLEEREAELLQSVPSRPSPDPETRDEAS